jgi:PAS domain S-box-containing protein
MTKKGLDSLFHVPVRKSLATRLTLLSMLIVVVTLAAVGTGLIVIARQAQRESLFRLQEANAEKVALMISGFMRRKAGDLQLFEETRHLAPMTPAQQREALESLLIYGQPSYSQLALLDGTGMERVKVSRFHTYLPRELRSQSSDLAFLTAMKGLTYISPVHIAPDSALLSVRIAVPVTALKDQAVGVLSAEVNIGPLWQEVSGVLIGRTGYAYLVDSRGSFIAYQEPSSVLQHLRDDMSRVPPVAAFMGHGKEGVSRVYEYRGLNGEQVIGVCAPIPGTSWAAIVELPTREAYASVARMQWYLLALSLLGLTAAGGLGLLVSRRLVEPIRGLTTTAQLMTEGDLNAEVVGLERHDEVGVLANTFRDMQSELNAVRRGLEERLRELRMTEAALHRSEEHYRAIFENTIEGIFQSTVDGRFLTVNPAAARTFGYDSPDQMIAAVTSLEHQIYVDPKERARFKAILEEKGTVAAFEIEDYKRNGDRMWVSVNARTVRDASGVILYYEGTIEDITERKRIEEELRESEERYRIAIESSNDGIAIMRGDKHVYVNRRFVEMFGYDDAGEIIGESNRLTVHPDDRKMVSDINLRRQKGEPVPSKYEFKGIKKDNTLVYVEVSATNTVHRGVPVSLVFLRDVTERRESMEALREAEKEYRTIFENAVEGIFQSTPDGRVIRANPAIARIHGDDSPEEFMSSVGDLGGMYVDPDQRKEFSRILQEKGAVDNFETQLYRKTGEKVWVLINARVVRDRDGAIAYYEGTLQDVTEQKQLQSQLLQAQKMEAIGQLAGGIAHDFNNILTALMGYAGILKMKIGANDPLGKYVNQILVSSEKAASLTRGLLAFSRKQLMELKPHKVGSIVRDMEKILRRLLTEDIELKVLLAEKDPVISADKSQIDQVLLNLVTNARDAMPKGGTLTIETREVELDMEFTTSRGYGEPGRYALISVSDNGTGVDEKTRGRMFEPFFTTKGVGQGTGLGLSVVYGIVQQHNGYIDVESEAGQGTTFRIYLPPAKAPEEKNVCRADETVGGTETILVAEDNSAVRTLVKEVLENSGYTVVEAVDGQDAVERFAENENVVALVVLDVVMPRKSGKEACNEIRQIRPDIKILFTSGYTGDVVLAKGLAEGDSSFVAKPLLPSVLLAKVREVLDG